jgi:adenosylcobinamide-GDP ribazoletransferase
VTGKRPLQNARGECTPGGFAEPHAEVEQRLLAEPAQHFAMRPLGRDVASNAVIQRMRIAGVQDGSRRADDIAVEDHRDTLQSRREDRAGDRRNFPTAETAQDFERIVAIGLVQSDCAFDRRDFARPTGIIDAGTTADPIPGTAAIERAVDRRRDGGVADSHVAWDEQIGPIGNRLHAKGERAGCLPLVHGRVAGDVARRHVEGEFEDFQAEPERGADLIDRGAAGGKICHHLARDLGRIGGDALRHDTVIAGKHRDERPVEGGHVPALPAGEPGDQFFEPPERARRLCQLALALRHRLTGAARRLRHQPEQCADIVEGRGFGHVSSASIGCGCSAQSQRALLDSGGAVLHANSMDRVLSDLLACLRFYTGLPLPAVEADPHTMPDFSRAAALVPIAGALIGLSGALVLTLAASLGLAPLAAATVAIGFLVLITGAMHEDGLADLCDGFGGGATAERKLEIMKDSRIGTYGAVALVLSLLLRVGTLAGLVAVDLRLATAVLIAAAAISRAAGLLPLVLLSPARTFGAGFAAARPSARAFGIAAALAFLCACLPLLAGGTLPQIIAGYIVALLAAYGMTALARRQIGGHTGDVAGAAQQAAEIAILLVFSSGLTIGG